MNTSDFKRRLRSLAASDMFRAPRARARLLCVLIAWTLHLHAGAQTYLGNVTGYDAAGQAFNVHAGTSTVRFIFYTPDIVRVDFLPVPGTQCDSSLVVIRDTTAPVPYALSETDSTVTLQSSSMRIVIGTSPFRIAYFSSAGTPLLSEPPSGGLATQQSARLATFSLRAGDRFYGTGERGIGLDLHGQSFDSYNTQNFGYSGPLPTMNVNVPLIVSPGGYAIYFENTYRGRFDLGASDPSRWWYRAFGGELSYFFIAAPTVPDQLERYTWLTGRQPLPPRWALGFLQSKYGYRNETEARTMVQTMRQKQIPCDAIVLDLYWYDKMGDLSWSPTNFPNPFQMMSDFLADGFKTIVITEPYIISTTGNWSVASGNNYLTSDSTGSSYLLQNWWSCNCPASLLDMTNPSAREWWWSKHPSFFGTGLAGIWTDLGEPERHPDDMIHAMGSTAKVHNVYNLLWARTISEGFGRFRPNSRLFNLTRSGYAGIQRYGVTTWSGDVGNNFGGLAVQPAILLNMGMSGIAYHNSDISGFCCGATTPELYVRWMEFGALGPVARAHGTGHPTEPWGYDSTVEAISRKFIELRYRLLPYLYTMAYENSQSGMPIARPLFFEDPGDPSLANESSSYLLGDGMLVSPVVQAGQGSKNVYLPAGRWVDFWTDELREGGQSYLVPTPPETIPIFVKAGSILPMQPVMQYTGERPLDTLTLAVYPLEGVPAHFSLYEDDGASLAYQSGEHAQTEFSEELSHGTMTIMIHPALGTYAGQPAKRSYLSEIHGIAATPTSVRKNGMPLAQRASYNELRLNGDGYYYDTTGRRLYVHTPTAPESLYTIVVDGTVLSVAEKPNNPAGFLLDAAYPNPFNPNTVMHYGLPSNSRVSLKIYDMLGHEVATLVDEVQHAGSYSVKWNAGSLPSGVYFCRMQAGTFTGTRKLLLIK